MNAHPGNTQNVIRVPNFGHRPRGDDDQVGHPRHDSVTHDNGDYALNAALFAQAFALLRLNKLCMFWLELGLYPGSGVFETCSDIGELVPSNLSVETWESLEGIRLVRTLARPEKVICERECDKTGEGQDKEREKLSLVKMSVRVFHWLPIQKATDLVIVIVVGRHGEAISQWTRSPAAGRTGTKRVSPGH